MTVEGVRRTDRLDTLSPEQRRALGCIRPIRLLPHVDGELQGDVVLTNCGTRLASKCPYCSYIYVGDVSKLLRLGIFGGCKRLLWITFTLPSYGAVHFVPTEGETEAQRSRGLPSKAAYRRCRCGVYHDPDDPLRGTPLDVQRYDYDGAVIGNYMAGELMSETVRRMSRHLRPESYLLPSARVMEMQQRLVVHFHMVVRLDGDEPIDVAALRDVILGTKVDHVPKDRRRRTRSVQWGSQLDISLIDLATEAGRRHAAQTQGYVPKVLAYQVKGLADGVTSAEAPLRALHVRHMRAAARKLLKTEGMTERKLDRQVGAFGWHGQIFRASSTWAPGLNLTTLRQVRLDYARAKAAQSGAPSTMPDVRFVAESLAPAATVADVMDQQNFGYSDQDYRDTTRSCQTPPGINSAVEESPSPKVEAVRERRAVKAERQRATAAAKELDDNSEYD